MHAVPELQPATRYEAARFCGLLATKPGQGADAVLARKRRDRASRATRRRLAEKRFRHAYSGARNPFAGAEPPHPLANNARLWEQP